jgi:hypothetical protein
VKNSAVKVVHRLPAKDDRDFVGATMNLDEAQSEHVVALRPGIAVAHTDGMDRPVLIAVDGSGEARESKAGASTAPPVGQRGPGCQATCARRPCDLDLIVRAEHLPETKWMTLWAEVEVIGHLMGKPVGRLARGFHSTLATFPRPLLSCAAGLAAERAVDRRGRSVQRWYDPRDLAGHVAEHMRAQLATPLDAGKPEPRWRVRYTDISTALRTEPAAHEDSSSPHPSTAHWARRGVRLDGPTWRNQLDQLATIIGGDERNTNPGTVRGDLSEVLDVVRSVGLGDTDAQRVRHVLRHLGVGGSWAVHDLTTWLKG